MIYHLLLLSPYQVSTLHQMTPRLLSPFPAAAVAAVAAAAVAAATAAVAEYSISCITYSQYHLIYTALN